MEGTLIFIFCMLFSAQESVIFFEDYRNLKLHWCFSRFQSISSLWALSKTLKNRWIFSRTFGSGLSDYIIQAWSCLYVIKM